MSRSTRRRFLASVGQGMLIGGLGIELSNEMGLSKLQASVSTDRLDFGALEPLVSLMQESHPDKLTELLVDRLASGTSLKEVVAAGALSNARTFGGQDYIGFHTFMALAPAYRMAQALPEAERPLPVLKVLHRNAKRIQDFGGRNSEVLHEVSRDPSSSQELTGEELRRLTRTGNIVQAERAFASLSDAPIGEAFNHLQFAVDDEVDVHRVVLAWRGWDTRQLAGEEWGHCLLRQSVRYCADRERSRLENRRPASEIRSVLPKLLDQYDLMSPELGSRSADDTWIRELAETIFRGSRAQAADAAAQALHDGWNPEDIGEAMSIAANMLVLHDPGRPSKWAKEGKPAGSCHGDSVGVHASDAANAWRNIARVSNPRNVAASLIVGAFHTAGQAGRSNKRPYPLDEHLAEVRSTDQRTLLEEAKDSIAAGDQMHASAVMSKYAEMECDPDAAFDLMLQFATRQDGALHAEKFYSTAREEFATTRPAFRWGQLVALARVSASGQGFQSDGYELAHQLLKI